MSITYLNMCCFAVVIYKSKGEGKTKKKMVVTFKRTVK
jgi:hypothetical protein